MLVSSIFNILLKKHHHARSLAGGLNAACIMVLE